MFLSILTFLPLLFALVILISPSGAAAKKMTLVFTTVVFFLSLFLFKIFDPTTPDLQLVEKYPWVESLGINYFLAIDGISFWLVLLTTFITPLSVLAAWNLVSKNTKLFCIAVLALETTMLGTFLSMNAVLFYTFFEASLIPMYFIIGIWGGSRRLYATLKFFIYTMAGSIFMLLGIVALMMLSGQQNGGQISADLPVLYQLEIPFIAGQILSTQTLLFLAFSIAFAIKIPVFPFHTWLPDAHVEAPTPGSVILAAVLLKMGTYGFLRFVFPLFPEATEHWGWIYLLLGTFGVVYGALVAMVQPDMKKLVAYSSVSHMGYIVLGLFALNIEGVTGAIYQMLNHGVSTGALFLLVGMVYERTHTREIKNYGGLASAAPIFTIAFIVVTLSSIAVPMTNGFVGEFLILLGTFAAHKWYAIVAVSGVVLGATYMLWMVKKVFFGEESSTVIEHRGELDLNKRELVIIAPFIVLIFWMGLYPKHFLSWSDTSTRHLIENFRNYQVSERVNPDQRLQIAGDGK